MKINAGYQMARPGQPGTGDCGVEAGESLAQRSPDVSIDSRARYPEVMPATGLIGKLKTSEVQSSP